MNRDITYVLIHSPLVGPLTWQLVQREMQSRGLDAVVPTLVDRPDPAEPYWQQHAASIAESLSAILLNRSLVLIAHSGAGPLLPSMAQSTARAIHSYVFVDAGLPQNNLGRLDLMRLEDAVWAEQFHQSLLQGETYPNWSEQDLQEVIPDESLRRKMISELRPRPLEFFTEPIPVFGGWPDAPCAYIKFSMPYDRDFRRAKEAGWPVHEVEGGHFHMLVDPRGVTNVIVDTVRELSQLRRD